MRRAPRPAVRLSHPDPPARAHQALKHGPCPRSQTPESPSKAWNNRAQDRDRSNGFRPIGGPLPILNPIRAFLRRSAEVPLQTTDLQ